MTQLSFILFFTIMALSSCKTMDTQSSGLSTLDQRQAPIMYRGGSLVNWKVVLRGNDDLKVSQARNARGQMVIRPAETQHTTALLEFITYDVKGELYLDYIYYSPAILTS